jgi:hypothetical protein
MTSKRLWSLSGLASETDRNFRTIAKALANVKPDGKIAGKPAWHMSTAIAAVEEHTRRTGRVPTRAAPERFDPGLEAQIDAIETSGAEVDALLKELRAEPSVERRGEMIEGGAGKCIGWHERALLATVGTGVHAPLRRVYVHQMMAAALAEIEKLCAWKVLL